MATNAANAATLWLMDVTGDSWDQVFALTMSSRLVFNASPTKLGAGCVMTVARKLARAELEDCAISERMGSANYMLEGVCKAITSPGEYQLDAVWASWVLVVYLCCHPEGRVLLRDTPLTDVDYQTAQAFEMYGRAEITRRARLEAAQQNGGGRKRKSPAVPSQEAVETVSPNAVMDVVDQIADEEQKTLATKRKRGAKGCASASTSDSSGMLQWWYGALRCDNSSVLKSLIAHSKQAARDAAAATLEKQTEGTSSTVASNLVIRGISEQNAEASAKALVPFVGRRPTEMPALIAWSWRGKVYRGITRTEGEARTTTLHACYMAPAPLQPATRTKMRLAWSVASMQYAPRSDAYTVLPSILERLQGLSSVAERGKRGELLASRMAAMVLAEAEPPRPTALSGTTRSSISAAIKLCVNASQQQIGLELSNQLKTMTLSDTPTCHSLSVPVLQALEQNPAMRREPLCSPASRLALGIALNEELRIWMHGKTRKNDPCKVMLGVASQTEKQRDAPPIINAEPPPLLTIVDFNLELLPSGKETLQNNTFQPHASQCPDVDFGLALHVCGDGATRVPEMLVALHTELHQPVSEFVRQARACIWAAMSQASYIGNVGSTISAGFANSAISSSKKISVRYTMHLSKPCLPCLTYPLGVHRSPTTTAYRCSQRLTSMPSA